MNEIIQSIPIYMSKHISDMIANDPSAINLSIGEPYFLPPNQLYEHLKENLFSKADFSNISNKYADSKGSFALRQEIANRYERLYFAKLDPAREILVTHGAAEAIWLSILTLTSIGDEVIIMILLIRCTQLL